MKENIRELVIVTLGILIAFALNSWNEERKAIRESENYLEGIKIELAHNFKEIKKALPYHQGLLKKLQQTPLEANIVLNAPHLQNIAWKLAENQVFKTHTDADLYRKIARCYQINKYLIEADQNASDRMSEVNIMAPYHMISTLSDKLSDKEYETFKRRTKQSWIPIFESWTAGEERYFKELQELLDELGVKIDDPEGN